MKQGREEAIGGGRVQRSEGGVHVHFDIGRVSALKMMIKIAIYTVIIV